MVRDLKAVAARVETGAEFEAYRDALAQLPATAATADDGAALPSQPLKRELLASYLADAEALLLKHTLRWRRENVACGVGDEPALARALARGAAGLPCDSGVVHSVAHGCEIDTAELVEFVFGPDAGGDARACFDVSFVARDHAQELALLRDAPAGAPLDVQHALYDSALGGLRACIEDRVLPMMSQTMRVEAGVREASFEAAASTRSR